MRPVPSMSSRTVREGTGTPAHPSPTDTVRGDRLHRSPAWPLTLLLAGFPLWWLLGLSAIAPLVLAVPMALQLARSRPVRLPRGTTWWLIFLVWVAASGLMLWVDAPGAVPGGGFSRVLVFAYRLAWYLACTVAFLWVANSDERDVPTRRVTGLLGWMFVVVVAGGWLGMVWPRFEITSPVEALLPGSFAQNAFIQSLVHPQAATLTTFLGREEFRPVAPFAYANSWGSNLSLFLPFFLLTWLGKGAGWRRRAAPLVLAAAAAPVVYSMNRGLWAALAVGALVLLVRAAVRGHARFLVAAVAVGTLAATVFAASPLADRLTERLDTAHSNDRRGQLLTQTVTSTLEGSPVLGFGSTRDVQGSFASIAGGSTPDCPACGVPPLGTQGHLWLVLFSQGAVGLLFFLSFFLAHARSHWRARSPLETAGIVVLLFFAIEIFVYDTLGMPLYTVMLALGLMWRAHADGGSTADPRPHPTPTLEGLLARLRARLGLIILFVVGGAAVGLVIASAAQTTYEARVTLLLAEAPLHLDARSGRADTSGRTTVDTEAALIVSAATLERLRTEVGALPPDVRARITITAPPNTRMLTVHYRDTDRERARTVAGHLADAYLATREGYLAQRRDQVLVSLNEQLTELHGMRDSGGAGLTEDEVRTAIDTLEFTSTDAGEVVNAAEVGRLRTNPELPVASVMLTGLATGVAVTLATTDPNLGSGGTAPRRRTRTTPRGTPWTT